MCQTTQLCDQDWFLQSLPPSDVKDSITFLVSYWVYSSWNLQKPEVVPWCDDGTKHPIYDIHVMWYVCLGIEISWSARMMTRKWPLAWGPSVLIGYSFVLLMMMSPVLRCCVISSRKWVWTKSLMIHSGHAFGENPVQSIPKFRRTKDTGFR